MKLRLLPSLLLALAVGSTMAVRAADAPPAGPKPLKVLLIAGGCCHDYTQQKEILKAGLEARANVQVDQIFTADRSTKPPFPMIYGNPHYADGYDVIIHDECAAGVNEQSVVEGVLAPHRDGIPGVNLHCAMHCYRIGNPNEAVTELGTPHGLWFEYLGLQSSGHGPQLPIDVSYVDKDSPITKGFADWTTIKEEHYNNIKIFDTAHPLAHGKQTVPGKKQPDGTAGPDEVKDWVDVWTNIYNGKTRVFSTTLGHNNETVGSDKYLDLVTRGLLWACDKLNDDGTPKAGYGPHGK